MVCLKRSIPLQIFKGCLLKFYMVFFYYYVENVFLGVSVALQAAVLKYLITAPLRFR